MGTSIDSKLSDDIAHHSAPEGNRTPDFQLERLASLASGDSGSTKVVGRIRTTTGRAHSVARVRSALEIHDFQNDNLLLCGQARPPLCYHDAKPVYAGPDGPDAETRSRTSRNPVNNRIPAPSGTSRHVGGPTGVSRHDVFATYVRNEESQSYPEGPDGIRTRYPAVKSRLPVLIGSGPACANPDLNRDYRLGKPVSSPS